MAFRLQSGLRITSWLRKKSVGMQKEIDKAETDIVPRVTRGVRGPVTVRAWLPLVLPASLFGLMDPTLAPTPPLCLNGRPVQLHQWAPSSPIPFHLADGCGRGLFSPWNCAITVRQARWSVRFVTNQSKDLLPRSRWICFSFLLGSEIENDKSQMHRVSPQRGWCRMIARANRVLSFLRLPGLWALTAKAEILPDITVETCLTDVFLLNHSPFPQYSKHATWIALSEIQTEAFLYKVVHAQLCISYASLWPRVEMAIFQD